jgi:hypothetical protein
LLWVLNAVLDEINKIFAHSSLLLSSKPWVVLMVLPIFSILV